MPENALLMKNAWVHLLEIMAYTGQPISHSTPYTIMRHTQQIIICVARACPNRNLAIEANGVSLGTGVCVTLRRTTQERFFTAPCRRLSPLGGLVATSP